MFSDAFTRIDSPIHRCDARVRIVVAVVWSITIALSQSFGAQIAGAIIAVYVAFLARLPLKATLLRLLPLNLFIAILCVMLPLTTPNTNELELGAIVGLLHAIGIGIRANTIVLSVTALVATLDVVTFGRALYALRVPPKLVTLLLFTVRYVAVIRTEYMALRRAMRVRCFRPRSDMHTVRTLGNLVGMLLVRGLERSARVLMAMKCRGYTGRFPLRELTPLRIADANFCAAAFLCIAVVVWAGSI